MEGAGIVTRAGEGFKTYNVCDRVAMVIQPTFANCVQCPVQYVHHIPNLLSSEEGSDHTNCKTYSRHEPEWHFRRNAKADVSNAEDVERAFKAAIQPTGEIIQGAVILRSISGIIGQKFQANHSAADVYLDAIVSYRHSQGLPVRSLDLEIIEEVGFAAREGPRETAIFPPQIAALSAATSVLLKISRSGIFGDANNVNFRQDAPLRTYSKHIQRSSKAPLLRKRPIEDSQNLDSSLPVKKVKRDSIRDYFKPVSISSSPLSTRQSSDPTDSTSLFSSPSLSLSTPPSSPPTRSPLSQPLFDSSARQKPRKLRRRLQTKQTLPSINMASPIENSTHGGDATVNDKNTVASSGASILSGSTLIQDVDDVSTPPIDIPAKENVVPQGYTQLQLELGVDPLRECKECGMHYNASNNADKRAHESYHRDVVRGKEMKLKKPVIVIMQMVEDGLQHEVRVIDRRASCEWRDQAMNALQASLDDLPGFLPTTSEIWSEITNPMDASDKNKVPRYRTYFYTIHNIVVGVLLAERIGKAGMYYSGRITHDGFGPYPDVIFAHEIAKSKDPLDNEFQEYFSKDEAYPAYLSVDRIWVASEHRKEGIATCLVDLARATFINGLSISKKNIAFSPTTSSGHAFAEKYCEDVFDNFPFLVSFNNPTLDYVENEKLNPSLFSTRVVSDEVEPREPVDG
ncbi:hypothetical protein B7494_g8402 [Chlorociboria aeruginascens]|nr:hypothetical protein B7494_g8402 [Chlorociboria aeruginascens]